MPEKRLASLTTQSGCDLQLLLVIREKPPFEERQLHVRFEDFRSVGEWFEFSDEIRSLVERLKNDPTPLPEDDRAVTCPSEETYNDPSISLTPKEIRAAQREYGHREERPSTSKSLRSPAYGLPPQWYSDEDDGS